MYLDVQGIGERLDLNVESRTRRTRTTTKSVAFLAAVIYVVELTFVNIYPFFVGNGHDGGCGRRGQNEAFDAWNVACRSDCCQSMLNRATDDLVWVRVQSQVRCLAPRKSASALWYIIVEHSAAEILTT